MIETAKTNYQTPQTKKTQNQPPHIQGEERPLAKTGCSLLQNCISNFNTANKFISGSVSETFHC